MKQMDAVEKAFQEWQKNPTDRPVVVDKLEIDFGRMKLKKKKDEVCDILLLLLLFVIII